MVSHASDVARRWLTLLEIDTCIRGSGAVAVLDLGVAHPLEVVE